MLALPTVKDSLLLGCTTLIKHSGTLIRNGREFQHLECEGVWVGVASREDKSDAVESERCSGERQLLLEDGHDNVSCSLLCPCRT